MKHVWPINWYYLFVVLNWNDVYLTLISWGVNYLEIFIIPKIKDVIVINIGTYLPIWARLCQRPIVISLSQCSDFIIGLEMVTISVMSSYCLWWVWYMLEMMFFGISVQNDTFMTGWTNCSSGSCPVQPEKSDPWTRREKSQYCSGWRW